MAQSEDASERRVAIDQLRDTFPILDDKKQAWEDLLKLTQDEDAYFRWNSSRSLGIVFPYLNDKEQAQKDLHKLTLDKESKLQGTAYPIVLPVSNKKLAWEDLTPMNPYNAKLERFNEAFGFTGGGHVHPQPRTTGNKNHLFWLMYEKGIVVRLVAVRSLGIAYLYISDKKEVWEDLLRLTTDIDCGVRAAANHSLGRASILKATEVGSLDEFNVTLQVKQF